MASASDKILHLRHLLAERLPPKPPASQECCTTGLHALDQWDVPRAALTEIVAPPAAGPGGGLLLYGFLQATLQKGERVILIDGKSAFAPRGLPQPVLDRLLWTRCREAWEAIKAADLAVRDGNMPLVILLLTLNPTAELRRIPATTWHRLQMLCEKSAVTLFVFTPHAQIGCARLRLSVGGAFPLDRLHICRDDLFPALTVREERRRLGAGRTLDEELRRASCA